MARRRAAQLSLEGLGKPRSVTPTLPRQAERDFMHAVVTYAGLRGWRHWHDAATNAPRACWHCGRRSTAPRNPAGWPDLVLIRRPRILFVELKREGESPTPDQQRWLDDLIACGQDARIWLPSSWPEIESALR